MTRKNTNKTANTTKTEIKPEIKPEEKAAEPEEPKTTPTDTPEKEVEEEKNTSAHDLAYNKIYDEILEHFRSFSPADQIASRITEEHITEYLEGANEEKLQQYKERREKRLLHFLEVIAILTAVVLVVKFLSDNPALLTTILYIIGGLIALYIWKRPRKDENSTGN